MGFWGVVTYLFLRGIGFCCGNYIYSGESLGFVVFRCR